MYIKQLKEEEEYTQMHNDPLWTKNMHETRSPRHAKQKATQPANQNSPVRAAIIEAENQITICGGWHQMTETHGGAKKNIISQAGVKRWGVLGCRSVSQTMLNSKICKKKQKEKKTGIYLSMILNDQ